MYYGELLLKSLHLITMDLHLITMLISYKSQVIVELVLHANDDALDICFILMDNNLHMSF